MHPPHTLTRHVNRATITHNVIQIRSFKRLTNVLISRRHSLQIIHRKTKRLTRISNKILIIRLPITIINNLRKFNINSHVTHLHINHTTHNYNYNLIKNSKTRLNAKFKAQSHQANRTNRLDNHHNKVINRRAEIKQLLSVKGDRNNNHDTSRDHGKYK